MTLIECLQSRGRVVAETTTHLEQANNVNKRIKNFSAHFRDDGTCLNFYIFSTPSWPCASSVSSLARFTGPETRHIISVCLPPFGKLLKHSRISFYCYFRLKMNFWGNEVSCTLGRALKNVPTQRSSESFQDLFPNKVSRMRKKTKFNPFSSFPQFPPMISSASSRCYRFRTQQKKMFMALIPFL